MMSNSCPEHQLPPEIALTGSTVAIGSQSYHQVTVPLDDDKSVKLLREQHYRLCRIRADAQDPRQNRRGVYRRRLPYEGHPAPWED